MFVFLDIPQTGGTTFATIFERQFPEQAVRHFPGGISDEDWDEFITSREVDNYTALMGYIEYSKVEKIRAPCTCITMIRHPVARAVSEYRFVISHEDNPFHEACKSMSLLEYVSSKYYPGNLQSGYLCGTDLPDPPPQDAVELWNEHIRITERYIEEHIDFVGITERFDESVAFFGDAALEEGVFHECGNFAALRRLPVLFVCENNLYSVYTHLDDRQPKRPLTEVSRAHGMPALAGDGNDVVAVYQATREAVERARRGEGPTFLLFDTYRWREHCGPNYDNDIGYRSESEYLEWRERCPIARQRRLLFEAGLLDPDQEEARIAKIRTEIDAAFAFAKSTPLADPSQASDHVYA